MLQKELSALKMIIDMLDRLQVLDVLDYQNRNNNTALHLAAESQQLEAVKLLLEAGASCNITVKDGDSPVHICVRNNDSSILKLLFLHKV